MNQHIGGVHEAVGGTAKKFVEPAERLPQQTLLRSFVFGFEKQRCKCRRKCECVERRDQHGDGNCHRELLIQPAGNAWNERRRDKHRSENQRNGHHRTAHFFHGFYGRRPRRHALFNVMLHGLDHDDGVINHQADRQHQAEER